MGSLIGLVFGVGVLMIGSATTGTPGHKQLRPVRREGRLAFLLATSGVEGVSPAQVLALCFGSFVIAAIVMLGVSGVLAVGVVFGLMAAWLPVAVLRVDGDCRRQRHIDLGVAQGEVCRVAPSLQLDDLALDPEH